MISLLETMKDRWTWRCNWACIGRSIVWYCHDVCRYCHDYPDTVLSSILRYLILSFTVGGNL